ncbi:MAG: hypothetical protein IPM51_14070 [Sphingobacteriaceae bacterium]|nr:hypothetical protein [Sphingobacteriaceae bacterium]
MKTLLNNKAVLFLVGTMLLSTQRASAGIVEKFQTFIGNEFSSFEGLYIMAGVIIGGLVFYIVSNHFVKEEKKESRPNLSVARERRNHHQRVIKKTA